MTQVYVRKDEPIEITLKRFNKKVNESRILIEAKQRREYIKPSDKKRKAKAAGKARQMKRQRKVEKQLQYMDSHKFPTRGESYNQVNKKNSNHTVYVGSLPYSTTEQELHNYIESVVLVRSTKIIYDKETGKSKGFGFIELYDRQDADKVTELLNGKEFQGRRLIINPNDQKKKKKPPRQTTKNTVNLEEEKKASQESLKDLQNKFSKKTG